MSWSQEDITVSEIESFIARADTHGVFSSRHRWHDNFVSHFEKLIDVKQIVTFREDGKLVGICSWAFVDKQRKQQINKATWKLPEEISHGDIFYVDVCLLQGAARMFQLKKFLEGKLEPQTKEVYWFDIPNGHVFRRKFKGGVLCQTAV